MSKDVSKAERALLDRVATMTATEADALAGRSATAHRKAEGAAQSLLFPVAVALGRQVALGVVVDGRAKKSDTAVESFGTWGKRHGYEKSATVTLIRRLAQAVGHGVTPTSDPEVWSALVQVGTRKPVGEALDKKPGAKNSADVRKAVIAQRDGTAKKSTEKRKAQTPDGKSTDKGDVTALTAGNIDRVVTGLRAWLDAPGNLSAISDEALVTIRAHFADMAEAVEAEGHRRIAAKRKPAAGRNVAARAS